MIHSIGGHSGTVITLTFQFFPTADSFNILSRKWSVLSWPVKSAWASDGSCRLSWATLPAWPQRGTCRLLAVVSVGLQDPITAFSPQPHHIMSRKQQCFLPNGSTITRNRQVHWQVQTIRFSRCSGIFLSKRTEITENVRHGWSFREWCRLKRLQLASHLPKGQSLNCELKRNLLRRLRFLSIVLPCPSFSPWSYISRWFKIRWK